MILKQQKRQRKCCSPRTALFRPSYIILNLELFHLYNFFSTQSTFLTTRNVEKSVERK